MKRNYLAIFILPKPQNEHAEIVNVIRQVSGGDFTAAYVGASGIGYLFSSEEMPWNIGFGRILMNDDSLLIIEVGDAFSQRNLGKAEAWLKAHRQQ